jgi:phosphocarrier protein HPr
MYEQTVVVTNSSGLHARPAALFVKAAAAFQAAITVRHGAKTADAKSMLKVLALGVNAGAELIISAEGPDEEQAVAALAALVSGGLGE